MDGRSQIKVHTHERTQVHSTQSALAVAHPSTNQARSYSTSVTQLPSKHWWPPRTRLVGRFNHTFELILSRQLSPLFNPFQFNGPPHRSRSIVFSDLHSLLRSKHPSFARSAMFSARMLWRSFSMVNGLIFHEIILNSTCHIKQLFVNLIRWMA